jgi:hypothetical protein
LQIEVASLSHNASTLPFWWARREGSSGGHAISSITRPSGADCGVFSLTGLPPASGISLKKAGVGFIMDYGCMPPDGVRALGRRPAPAASHELPAAEPAPHCPDEGLLGRRVRGHARIAVRGDGPHLRKQLAGEDILSRRARGGPGRRSCGTMPGGCGLAVDVYVVGFLMVSFIIYPQIHCNETLAFF